ncbi:MAG TPA: hypothetical protein DDZ84_07265 [Firmicutes bacterium]|nr:hypothetical protein [Bacillota bacterium]
MHQTGTYRGSTVTSIGTVVCRCPDNSISCPERDVMQPGMLTVTIRIGEVTKSCDYRVLGERTGFGFGCLRPW